MINRFKKYNVVVCNLKIEFCNIKTIQKKQVSSCNMSKSMICIFKTLVGSKKFSIEKLMSKMSNTAYCGFLKKCFLSQLVSIPTKTSSKIVIFYLTALDNNLHSSGIAKNMLEKSQRKRIENYFFGRKYAKPFLNSFLYLKKKLRINFSA